MNKVCNFIIATPLILTVAATLTPVVAGSDAGKRDDVIELGVVVAICHDGDQDAGI